MGKVKRLSVIGLRGIPNVMGGVETHCANLYSEIIKCSNDYEINVIGRDRYIIDSTYSGIKVKALPSIYTSSLETLFHTFISIFYAKFFLKSNIVHLHAVGSGLFMPLVRLLGMKGVLTVHGADYKRSKWGRAAKFLLKLGEKLGITFSNQTIVVGKKLTEDLKFEYSKASNKITYIPNGIDINVDYDSEFSECDFLNSINLEQKGYILYVGRLDPAKGIEDLIKAYKSSGTELKLLIVGGSEHKGEFYHHITSYADENIIFSGVLSGDSLKAAYKNTALYVLPSYHEGHPISVLEAINFNAPLIVSDIIPNLSLNLPSENYYKLADIDALASKVTEGKFKKVDREQYIQLYNWQTIAKDTLFVYSKES